MVKHGDRVVRRQRPRVTRSTRAGSQDRGRPTAAIAEAIGVGVADGAIANEQGVAHMPDPFLSVRQSQETLLAGRAARLAFGKAGRRVGARADRAGRAGRIQVRGRARPTRGRTHERQ